MTKPHLRHADLKQDLVNHYYEFRGFRKFGVIAAFSGRHYKMNFTETGPRTVVIAQRKHFCEQAGIDFNKLVCLEQVHGSNIIRVGESEAGRGARDPESALPHSDAVITNQSGIVLSVRTADCAPVFFLDKKRRAIGMAHIGWRGAAAKLSAKMIQAFRVQFLSKPEDLLIAIGPMIRSCCYEVGDEFLPEFKTFVKRRKKKLYFDLTRQIVDNLISEGIAETQVVDCRICTVCENKKFSSYRKEGAQFRTMMSVMSLI
ncbi:MAG: hypothetical protein A3G33_06665 [Omnitrophica bacterium RIFCSPLOWO2_12_FULL_44_17]|uniref:Purine nucleoside phosphorylase n=1 Tax=Candidatus Danuiimicrobium aquiferis TaxID=1801832 RepID=A0A1G1L2I1_9BACT|nr:MAG: hypothetical protein A3B72_03240 [Omnitrophica bacterium RIFCSPHIGHO2_02_FULL_45_28]OGW92491.1 MAG: hypothetical protein A3E74_05910 [Omnitrophica bacterium RIFCSPHIGHO2_12_FULL_44_12]OGW99365.1 MAG: hypothetical protein A3G33_06665 [Omnitrophica bacterium RIFCSPLOWO2_12_FULL_44_17]OGX03239.1 MAG: hypothetical protein A3J12_11720 [Omnitrophica bacterium RIFCSPLOWO2_02_FULL_44_11]